MNRTSFEKSLAFLAPNLTGGKKKKVVSPVRVPEHNEEDLLAIESLLKGDSPVSHRKEEEESEDEREEEREEEESEEERETQVSEEEIEEDESEEERETQECGRK